MLDKIKFTWGQLLFPGSFLLFADRRDGIAKPCRHWPYVRRMQDIPIWSLAPLAKSGQLRVSENLLGIVIFVRALTK